MPTVVFYIQHLLGMGHVHRTAALAETLARAGSRLDIDVVVVNGGSNDMTPLVPNCRVEQLPPITIHGTDFNDQRDAEGNPVDEAYRNTRRRRLLALISSLRPSALVLELYPFGRRGFAFELESMLELVAGWDDRPMVISSVRDVLVPPSKPERLDWIADQLSQHIDHILIHGDPGFMRLEDSFPVDPSYASRLHYTGFVVDRRGAESNGAGKLDVGDAVVVSAGGGAVGYELLACAMSAKALTRLADRPWHIVCGPSMPKDQLAQLMNHAPAGVSIERERNDMPLLHAKAALSIGQAGYNTVMEWLLAGRRGLAIPYAEGQETEQVVRATRLAEAGLLEIEPPEELTPERLAAAVDRLWERGTVLDPLPEIAMDGAGKTAAFILDHLRA
jgi:predicted glycosyltransferase